jgi:Nuclease-related domain
VNYARRQQYRRLSHAGKAGLGSVIAALFGLVIASAGAAALAGLLLVAAVGLDLHARHWLSLAGRSRVGARSEDEVRRALAPLQADGWRLRHSLRWRGQGDIDAVAIAPTGVVVAIETKTRTYDARHLARVREQATWLSRCRRRWSRHGALAVLCLVRVRGVERVEHDVLVVSIDRLVPLLSVAARMRSDPLTRLTRARRQRDWREDAAEEMRVNVGHASFGPYVAHRIFRRRPRSR